MSNATEPAYPVNSTSYPARDGDYTVHETAGGLTKRELRMFAVHSVEMIINRIGSDKFNEVLANPKPF